MPFARNYLPSEAVRGPYALFLHSRAGYTPITVTNRQLGCDDLVGILKQTLSYNVRSIFRAIVARKWTRVGCVEEYPKT